MNRADKAFLTLGGLLLCACAPDLVSASDPIGAVAGAVIAIGSGVLSFSMLFSLLSRGVRAVLTKLNVFGYRDRARYFEAIEHLLGRPMSAGERARFDRVYWS
jgi:hypothetical protein